MAVIPWLFEGYVQDSDRIESITRSENTNHSKQGLNAYSPYARYLKAEGQPKLNIVLAYQPTRGRTSGGTMEVFMPSGMQLFIAMYWLGGLSGIMLGTLAVNQGFFERYFDTQFLLIGQGGALAALGAAMFITATGLVSGARWSLEYSKRIAGVSIIYSALGITLAAYSALNMPGLASSIVMYGIIAWLAVFGIILGLFGLRYLSAEGASIRRFSEYVGTEVLSEDDERTYPAATYEAIPTRQALPAYVGRGRFCSSCGGRLNSEWTECPRCGTKTDGVGNVS